MCGRAYGPRFLFSWPSAKSAVMGPQQLAGVLSIVARQAAAARGEDYDEDADAAMRAAVEGQIESESDALVLSGMLYDDGIIDPRDTRTVLGIALSAVHTAPVQGTGALRGLPDVSADDRRAASWSPIGARSPGGDLRTCRDLRHRHRRRLLRRRSPFSPHVARPTPRCALPGATPADTYLRGDLIIDGGARGPAPTRSIPATGSCPRTPPSPAPFSTPG